MRGACKNLLFGLASWVIKPDEVQSAICLLETNVNLQAYCSTFQSPDYLNNPESKVRIENEVQIPYDLQKFSKAILESACAAVIHNRGESNNEDGTVNEEFIKTSKTLASARVSDGDRTQPHELHSFGGADQVVKRRHDSSDSLGSAAHIVQEFEVVVDYASKSHFMGSGVVRIEAFYENYTLYKDKIRVDIYGDGVVQTVEFGDSGTVSCNFQILSTIKKGIDFFFEIKYKVSNLNQTDQFISRSILLHSEYWPRLDDVVLVIQNEHVNCSYLPHLFTADIGVMLPSMENGENYKDLIKYDFWGGRYGTVEPKHTIEHGGELVSVEVQVTEFVENPTLWYNVSLGQEIKFTYANIEQQYNASCQRLGKVTHIVESAVATHSKKMLPNTYNMNINLTIIVQNENGEIINEPYKVTIYNEGFPDRIFWSNPSNYETTCQWELEGLKRTPDHKLEHLFQYAVSRPDGYGPSKRETVTINIDYCPPDNEVTISLLNYPTDCSNLTHPVYRGKVHSSFPLMQNGSPYKGSIEYTFVGLGNFSVYPHMAQAMAGTPVDIVGQPLLYQAFPQFASNLRISEGRCKIVYADIQKSFGSHCDPSSDFPSRSGLSGLSSTVPPSQLTEKSYHSALPTGSGASSLSPGVLSSQSDVSEFSSGLLSSRFSFLPSHTFVNGQSGAFSSQSSVSRLSSVVHPSQSDKKRLSSGVKLSQSGTNGSSSDLPPGQSGTKPSLLN